MLKRPIEMTCSAVVAYAMFDAGRSVLRAEPMAGVLLFIAALFACSYFIEAVIRLYSEVFQ